MTTAPRFRRPKPPQQYGTRDLRAMTAEEISEASEAGHFHDLENGDDPDAAVDHKDGCSKPRPVRDTGGASVRLGDPIRFVCRECGAEKVI